MSLSRDPKTRWQKLLGLHTEGPPRVSLSEVAWSWFGALLGIGLLALIGSPFFAEHKIPMLLGSFGASAVLIFGMPRSPLAQPRNLIGGHVISALVGVATWKLLQHSPPLAQATAVSTAIAAMHLTRTLHPPGGATALIATQSDPLINDLGFWFVLAPALAAPMILLLTALFINNLPATRRYPEYWW